MKKTLNFTGLYKLFVILAAAITVVGIAVLAIIGGETFANFTFANLSISLVLRAIVAAVLISCLVLLYFLIRFKKSGIAVGLYGAIGSAVSAVIAFALCIICRANLGNMTFAMALMGVALSYITTVLFCDRLNVKVARKKTAAINEDNYNEIANKAFAPMLVVLIIMAVIIIGAFVAALVFGSKVLALYALPAILTAVFSVLFTLAVPCRIIAKKI